MQKDAQALRVAQHQLEEAILFAVQNFERRTSMSVHAIRVFRGAKKNGHRETAHIEVDAQLR